MDLENIGRARADLRQYKLLAFSSRKFGTMLNTVQATEAPWELLVSFFAYNFMVLRSRALQTCLKNFILYRSSKNISQDLRLHSYFFRGHYANGLKGSQASFMEIFHGDGAKIDKLNEILCEKAGFPSCYSISTQTYTRKVDLTVADAVCAFGSTVQKIASDIRLLAHDKELEEPFEKDQIG